MLQTNATQQDNPEVEVARCSKGQYFGELALVTNKPRAASVYAVGDTKCLGRLKMMLCFPWFTRRGNESVFHTEHLHLASSKHNKSRRVEPTTSFLPTDTTLQVYMLYVGPSCSSQDSFYYKTVLNLIQIHIFRSASLTATHFVLVFSHRHSGFWTPVRTLHGNHEEEHFSIWGPASGAVWIKCGFKTLDYALF